MKILQRSFYQRDTVTVAEELIGKLLVRHCQSQRLVGRIVETEAYKGNDDPASHAYRRKTERNQAMFGEVGCAYVYFIYGAHFALNVVARNAVAPAGAVLIRAVEPLEGIEYMRGQRSKDAREDLASGPGKLAQAYAIDKLLYGYDMTKEGALYIVDDDADVMIKVTSRKGIHSGQDKLWRFLDSWSNFVSK